VSAVPGTTGCRRASGTAFPGTTGWWTPARDSRLKGTGLEPLWRSI
jgi:hypothetical protein